MADLYHVLYCFACKEYGIVVKRRAGKETMAKCGNCQTENKIGEILVAMDLGGKVPKRHPTTAVIDP